METILILGGIFLIILVQYQLEDERHTWEQNRYFEPPAIPYYPPPVSRESQTLPVVATILFALLLLALMMHDKETKPVKDNTPTENTEQKRRLEAKVIPFTQK